MWTLSKAVNFNRVMFF
jgi:Icc-related predicted phosphoesterase